MTSTPTKPVDNVVITTKGLQDRNIHILDGTTVENKCKLILTEIFPSLQKHGIFLILIITNSTNSMACKHRQSIHDTCKIVELLFAHSSEFLQI